MSTIKRMHESSHMSSIRDRTGIFCLPVADPLKDDLARAALNTVVSDIAFSQSQGFGFAWIAEHHNTAYGGCVPDPLTFIAAIGQRVPKIALGTAVLLAPLRHPAMIVEQVRLVARLVSSDIHLGLGRGFLPCDQADFGLSASEATKRFWEAVTSIACDETGAVPLSTIWVATTQAEGARKVGQLGLGLALNPYTRSEGEVDASIDAYKKSFHEADHAGAPRVLIHEPLLLASTREEARDWGGRYFATYLKSLKDAEQISRGHSVESHHQVGSEDYTGRCPFLDETGFHAHILSWLQRGVTHWCFQVRFGNMPDEVAHETIVRCGKITGRLLVS